ncbi:MAG: LacI family DNA-binding transcriptional regulator [Oscillospiraceae bacterium]|nr:LacI family DNA-binding transcriptional regulator [Oscillospiraceae bacterium]
MVSIKDIASACGVSIATVSKALNGHRDVSDETRERIRRTAEELGYLANASARALKTNRSYNIGVLFVDQRGSGLAHEFFSAVLDSIRVEAEASGYDITFINRTVGRQTSSYLQHCLYRGVDGVVIASVDFRDPMVVELVESALPVVTIDHSFNNRIAVMSDNVRGMEELVRYAAGRGHRRLAFIHGERTTVTENRLTGFHRACEALGIEERKEYLVEGAFHDTKACYEATKKLLALPVRPSCIFFPDDFSYIGGYNAITEAGLRIPEDISVVGYDGIHLSEVISPKLTTWRQSTTGLGREAAARLIELIEHPRTTLIDRQIVSGRLWEGESVKDLNACAKP